MLVQLDKDNTNLQMEVYKTEAAAAESQTELERELKDCQKNTAEQIRENMESRKKVQDEIDSKIHLL